MTGPGAGFPLRGTVRTVWVADVRPELDGGRFPVKRVVGDVLEVSADILCEGHASLAAVLLYRTAKDTGWREIPMEPVGNDRWLARFLLEENTRYVYTIEGWLDPYRSWAADLGKRLDAGMDVASELLEGAALLRAARPRVLGADGQRLQACLDAFERAGTLAERARLLLDPEVAALVDRSAATRYDRELEVVVDRPLAQFAAWYELFARSQGQVPGRHGTFRDCIERLPDIAAMGFDVVYLAPIHPVGRTARKGRNNALVAEPDAPGSPWAIGNEHGGHKAVEPALGALEDFRALTRAARDHGLEIALDYALQCSPDHPYVREHPEWFHRRPDGTIKYAENPPKKYQDIYPLNFYCRDREALWEELRSIVQFWIGEGVRIFRVDNPHTKPIPFWAWLIREIQAVHPDVIFLAEAFTRPKVMHRLAKLGFTQSYTYFAWRNTKYELTEYFTELSEGPGREYFRPNCWPNTPDILTEYLQVGGRPAFMSRLVLAATLSANYGIYGPAYEHGDNRPREAGSEEYLDSEKYQQRAWDLERPDSLAEFIGRVNAARRDNAALQSDRLLSFFPVDNDQLIGYGKTSPDRSNVIVAVVNLDPHHAQSGWIELDLEWLGLKQGESYQMHDLLTGARYLWNGPRNFVVLDPARVPAHVFRVRRHVRNERDFDYFAG